MNQYDQFKDKLHDYKVKVDKEKLWQNTSHAIPQKRRRRIILLFFMGMILVSGLIGYSIRTPSTSPTISQVNQLEPITTKEPIYENMAAEANSTTSGNTNSYITSASQEPQKHDDSVESFKTSNVSNRSLEQSFTKESIIEKKEVKGIKAHNPEPLNEQLPVSHEMQTLVSLPVANNRDLSKDELVRDEPGITPGLEENISSQPSLASTAVRSYIAPIFSIPALDVPLSLSINEKPQDKVSHSITPADPPSKMISFSVLAAVGLSSLDFKALNNEAKETTSLFNQHVRSLEHYSLEVAGRMPLSQGLTVQADLGWSHWTTETQNELTTYQSFTREGVSNIVIDENGVQQPVLGLVNGTRVIHTSQFRYTQYQTMDAGLSLYKNLWHKNRILIDVYGKGNVVLFDHTSGSTYNNEGELVKFSEKDSPFKIKYSFGIGAGLNMRYMLCRHMQIEATLGYQPTKYLWQQNQQQIDMTHSTLHGHLGMRYQL